VITVIAALAGFNTPVVSKIAKTINSLTKKNGEAQQPLPEEKNQPNEASRSLQGDVGVVKVIRVIDGDTIEIEGGRKVRYIGVNTPESVDPRRAVQCFGEEAKEYNKQLVEERFVRLEKDISEIDRYGRLLRYVYRIIDDNSAQENQKKEERMVNEQLVEDGYARIMTIPPDVAHIEDFKKAERIARTQKRGLWGSCR
jgi:micrococcal nuclease